MLSIQTEKLLLISVFRMISKFLTINIFCSMKRFAAIICLIFRTEYLLNFNDKFEIHDDIEILKEMGLSLGK